MKANSYNSLMYICIVLSIFSKEVNANVFMTPGSVNTVIEHLNRNDVDEKEKENKGEGAAQKEEPNNPTASTAKPPPESPIGSQSHNKVKDNILLFGLALQDAKKDPMNEGKRKKLLEDYGTFLKSNNAYVEEYKKGKLDINQAPTAQQLLVQTMDKNGILSETSKTSLEQKPNTTFIPKETSVKTEAQINKPFTTYVVQSHKNTEDKNQSLSSSKNKEGGSLNENLSQISKNETVSTTKNKGEISQLKNDEGLKDKKEDLTESTNSTSQSENLEEGEHPATDSVLTTLSETLESSPVGEQNIFNAPENEEQDALTLYKNKKRKIKFHKLSAPTRETASLNVSDSQSVKASIGRFDSELFKYSNTAIFILLILALILGAIVIKKIS